MESDGAKTAELVNRILGDKASELEAEEILHLLLEEKVSANIDTNRKLSFGDRAADGIARFAGSWRFILLFSGCMVVWVLVNVFTLLHPFDPYPFILLNLMLSCIAALQAPVIMMSQNRQEEKDRLRAQNDYKVNLKSEIIIEDLHRKLDELLENQRLMQKKLGEIQQSKN